MIEPALSAGAWKRYPDVAVGSLPPGDELPLYYPSRHGIAAANLYGQPFGFTHAHVQALREVSARLQEDGFMHEDVDEIAALIAALLPPEKP